MSGWVIAVLSCVVSWAQPGAPELGILVMAHGGDPQWNRDVEATVAPLREKYPVEIAYGMARTSTLREAAKRLEDRGARRIAVVRMFISGDSFLPATEYILGLRDTAPSEAEIGHLVHGPHGPSPAAGAGHHAPDSDHCMEKPERLDAKASFVLSRRGVSESPLVDEILLHRVKALSNDPKQESVLILAHGPGDEAENERWLANMRMRVQQLYKIGPFRHIECETLREDWPDRRAEAERRIRAYMKLGSENGGRVIVVPFRIAGFGPYKEVLEGFEYVADEKGFCPHPSMTRWIEETAQDCFAGLSARP